MKRFASLLLLLVVTLCVKAQAEAAFTFGTKTNPQGESLEVDRLGFRLNGQYVLPVMGEIHFSRVPQRDWRREVQKMRAGGITMIATYVFWIHHEPNEGQWNWQGNNDLRQFVSICKEEHMPVVLRIGPFCHGEVYLGGFPEWVVKRANDNPKQYNLRTTATGFISEVKSLYTHIFSQVKGLQWKDGGPIVGVQIENECRGPWDYYMTLKNMATEVGFDLPFYTRTGWPKLNGKEEFGKLLPLFGDYADGFWDRSLKDMPGSYPKAFIMKDERMSRVIATETFTAAELTDEKKDGKKAAGEAGMGVYPYLTCELGGGMMTSYHRRINMSGNEAFPLAICKLGSGSNLPGYYMYHGGTNPYNDQHTMAECQASATTNHNDMPHITYDFQAPLGEMGQPNWQSFHQTRWLHQFLADWGSELVKMEVDSLSANYARRGTFVFRNDYVRILHEEGTSSVTTQGMKWEGLTLSSDHLQPFAKADGGLYFITIGTRKSASQLKSEDCQLNVNGKDYTLAIDHPTSIEGKTFTLLSPERAKAAFVIDGKMHYAQHGGILFKDGETIKEESWEYQPTQLVARLTRKTTGLREVKMGRQNVAEQPSDTDFEQAAVYSLGKLTSALTSYKKGGKRLKGNADDYFLEINYKGDCARVYANGKMVEDNFWNGKPMLVRLTDVLNKKVEIRLLPLGKDYPIYLQAEQRAELEKAGKEGLLQLEGIRLLKRVTE